MGGAEGVLPAVRPRGARPRSGSRNSWRCSLPDSAGHARTLDEAAKKKQEAEKKLAEVMKDERALQDRRMSDVTAKLTRQLADVDLLIIPRYTTDDAMQGPGCSRRSTR